MPSATLRPVILEVERKFRHLAVSRLTRTAGVPPFQSLQVHANTRFQDIYYDQNNRLSSSGAWVRQRNGVWQAKIARGGDYLNSRFEEVQGIDAIAKHVERITGERANVTNHFGLQPTADLTTHRQSWTADSKFRIVLDTMDFGHEVGEVELERELKADEAWTDARKAQVMQDMDKEIEAFMNTYAWAFVPGTATGKLTAYFEKKKRLEAEKM